MKNRWVKISLASLYFLFIIVSALLKFKPGIAIGNNFLEFCLYIVKILPCAFILIGLFEVWIKSETIKKHFGVESGLKAHFWAIILASFTIGGIYVALPVSYSLFEKGADLEVIFTYIGASGVARIPMTLFEALFMGLGFAIWRRVFSLPLIIISSILLGRYLKTTKYKIVSGK